jgi:hypothetical protein
MGRKVGKLCVRVIKSKEIMWAAHVARVGEKSTGRDQFEILAL